MTFAVAVLRVTRGLPKDASGKHVARQLLRSGTSGGANYEEARGAESRADFVHKTKVAEKEMRESLYWLELIHRAGWQPLAAMEPLLREANELVAILFCSARTARQGP